MWIQKRQRDNRHDLHSKTASGEMPRTECRSIRLSTSPTLLTQLVQTDVIDELLYAVYMNKNASSEAKMQRAMEQVSQSYDNYDLTISTKNTEVVHQPAPGKLYNETTTTVNRQKLKVVDKFIYLGSTLSRAVHIDDEITARIAKAIWKTPCKCLGEKWDQA